MSETDLLSACLMALQLEPGVTVWRNNSGRKGRVRFGLGVGSADIVGLLLPAGRFLALECKTGGYKQSPEQVRWGNEVMARGGFYAVVTSVAEARWAVREARKREAKSA